MKNVSVLFAIFLVLTGGLFLVNCDCGGASDDSDSTGNDSTPAAAGSFALTSPAYVSAGTIPLKYACAEKGGQNLSIPLAWSNAPAETLAFALTLKDPDAPNGTVVHWGLINIPNDSGQLNEGIGGQNLPSGSWETLNYREEIGYGGPCPPAGQSHRYIFTLHALSKEFAKPASHQSVGEIQSELDQATIAKATLMGYYPTKP
ncbi:MAG: YbhB/YbcL family Raf kinase inhibitor-like protein [Myxococcales bacterium]|nr:YbhB/YbcL family Raf kinase inhibitor-like protein [Myxococcales bacterium]